MATGRSIGHLEAGHTTKMVSSALLAVLLLAVAYRLLGLGVRIREAGLRVNNIIWTWNVEWASIAMFGLAKRRRSHWRRSGYVDLVTGKRVWMNALGGLNEAKTERFVNELSTRLRAARSVPSPGAD